MSHPWESLANEHILGIAPYEPGKPIEELERELGITDVIKLASNENPLAPSERVLKAIAEALPHLNRYPDGSGHYLRQALGRRHGLSADHIVLGNGSNDLIELLARAFLRAGEEAVIPHPSFVVYPMIVQAVGGIRVVVTLKDYRLDLEAMARAMTPMTKMVFIANPNNPTATIVTADEVDHFMARVPDRAIVVFDEAYLEFAQGPDFPDTLNYLRHGRKVVILRTFSKAASLAGLRVGYAMADPDCVALLNRIRQPFNVNSVAQVAALAALEDGSHILECVRMIEAGRHYLCDEFTALGLKYAPSRANFIFVDVGKSATNVFQWLLKEGVIVRPMTSFGMEHALRVTIGTPKRTDASSKPSRKCWPGSRTRDPSPHPARARPPRRLGGQSRSGGRARARDRRGGAAAREPRAGAPGRDGRPHHARRREGVAGADLCVLCTPVATLTELLPAVWRAASDDVVITDVGSTKAGIVRAADALSDARPLAFVGSHPMAGSERSGYGVARADLFRGATVVVTPTERTSPGRGEARDGALGVARRAGHRARPGLP
jgi:histidinol-phosphate aminotransferase